MKASPKGFTLIELLVVISIIGVLSAVVLASLGTARTKAQDVRIIQSLTQIRSQAPLYTGLGNNTVSGTITDCVMYSNATSDNTLFNNTPSVQAVGPILKGLNLTAGTANSICHAVSGLPSAGAAWAVAIKTSSSTACIDSVGTFKTNYMDTAAALTLNGLGVSPVYTCR